MSMNNNIHAPVEAHEGLSSPDQMLDAILMKMERDGAKPDLETVTRLGFAILDSGEFGPCFLRGTEITQGEGWTNDPSKKNRAQEKIVEIIVDEELQNCLDRHGPFVRNCERTIAELSSISEKGIEEGAVKRSVDRLLKANETNEIIIGGQALSPLCFAGFIPKDDLPPKSERTERSNARENNKNIRAARFTDIKKELLRALSCFTAQPVAASAKVDMNDRPAQPVAAPAEVDKNDRLLAQLTEAVVSNSKLARSNRDLALTNSKILDNVEAQTAMIQQQVTTICKALAETRVVVAENSRGVAENRAGVAKNSAGVATNSRSITNLEDSTLKGFSDLNARLTKIEESLRQMEESEN